MFGPLVADAESESSECLCERFSLSLSLSLIHTYKLCYITPNDIMLPSLPGIALTR